MEPPRSSSYGCVRSLPPSWRAARAAAVTTLAGAAAVAGLVSWGGQPVAGAVPASPGIVFVANYGGTGSTGIAATGSVTSYRVGKSGDLHPLATISAGVSGPQGVAFDRSGNLWVSNSNTNTLVEFTKAALSQSSPKPVVTISAGPSGNLNGPGGLAFDSAGNLWVANTGVTTVVEYPKAELTKSGAPAPVLTISNNSFNVPFGVAFDKAGDLWVSDNAQPGSPGVFEYAKSRLGKVVPNPRLTFSLPTTNGGDDTRTGLAFDPAGNLWVVNSANGSLAEFAKTELARAGAVPRVSISSDSSGSLGAPNDISFDSRGDLWVANTGSSTVVEFVPAELAKSGSPKPLTTIGGTGTGLNYPMSVVVEPGSE